MPFKFINQPIERGSYEPEGIYLGSPLVGAWPAVQLWGSHSVYYGQFRYHGIPLKGYVGILFEVAPATQVIAVDSGRVVAISVENGGFGRYIKVEHRWGESLLAHLGDIDVDSGQMVERGQLLASAQRAAPPPVYVHFGIRVAPYNRFDGWGGFTDPLPYMDPDEFHTPDAWADAERQPVPILQETPSIRRP